MIAEDSVRFAHSGPSQRFLRGLRPLVSVGPLPLPVSAGGHASAITTILPIKYQTHVQDLGSFSVGVYIVKTRRDISGYCRRGTKDRR